MTVQTAWRDCRAQPNGNQSTRTQWWGYRRTLLHPLISAETNCISVINNCLSNLFVFSQWLKDWCQTLFHFFLNIVTWPNIRWISEKCSQDNRLRYEKQAEGRQRILLSAQNRNELGQTRRLSEHCQFVEHSSQKSEAKRGSDYSNTVKTFYARVHNVCDWKHPVTGL